MLCSHHHSRVPELFITSNGMSLVCLRMDFFGFTLGFAQILESVGLYLLPELLLANICLLCLSGSLMTYMSVRPSVIESHVYGTLFVYLLNYLFSVIQIR